MLGQDVTSQLTGEFEVISLNREQCDICRFDHISALITQEKPDWLINCAAYTNVETAESEFDQARRVNVMAVENLARICHENSIKLIHIGTDYVFDGQKDTPYREQDIPCPISAYGQSKYEGEKKIQAVSDRAFILRAGWLYAARGTNFVQKVMSSIDKGQDMSVVDDQIGSPTYVRDLARIIRELIKKNPENFGIYHANNTGSLSWYDFACAIQEKFKINAIKIQRIKTEDYQTKARRPKYSVMDNTKLSRLLGLPMRGWNEAFQECVAEIKRVQRR